MISYLLIFGILIVPSRVISQQLDCNFDQNSFCNWSNGVNGVEDDFDWQISNSVAVDGFHSIPRTLSGSGYFAYAQGKFRPTESDTAKAWLRSPTVDGLARSATLTFNYWKTAAPPVLQVCTRDAGASQLRCLDTISGLGDQQWVKREVTIPQNPFPFQIIFVATNFRTALDLTGLDDIQFRINTAISNSTFFDDPDVAPLNQTLTAKANEKHKNSKHLADALDQAALGRNILGREQSRANKSRTTTTTTPANGEPLDANEELKFRPTPAETQSRLEQARLQPQQLQPQTHPQDQQAQLQLELQRQRLLELQQQQQQFQLRQAQFPQPSSQFGSPASAPNIFRPAAERNFQLLNPANQQSLPPSGPQFFPGQPPPFAQPNGAAVPGPDAYFGPPIPSFPIDHAETSIDSAVGNGAVNSFLDPRSTQTAPKFTLPPNWFRAPVNKNDQETQAQTPVGAPIQAEDATTISSDQEHHHHDHDHEHTFGVCQVVTCKFDESFCNWFNDQTANFEWKLKNSHSQTQGIPQDFSARQSYVFVSGDQRRPDHKAIIRTAPLVAPSGAYLEFFSFVTDPTTTRLSAYRTIGSDRPNVLWQTLGNGQVDKNTWQRVRIPLPSSSFPFTLSLVADQMSTGQFIGIDGPRLVDSNGNDVGCAADTTFTSLGSTRLLLLTPFPPKDADDGLGTNSLQLSQLKAEALLNSPNQERQFVPAQLLTNPPAQLLTIPTSIPLSSNQFPSPTTLLPSQTVAPSRQAAVIQQRRIGVIETQGSFGTDLDDDSQQHRVSNNLQQPSGGLPKISDHDGRQGGLLQSFERQSPQWNVFQPAKTDQLPREFIYASQLPTAFTSVFDSTFLTVSTPSNFRTAVGLVATTSRPVEPVFPPGDSPEINDQDSFHRRRGSNGTRNALQRGPLLRLEPFDDAAINENRSAADEEKVGSRNSTGPSTTMNPDPLGFQDFVSSLTRDLQVLAGGNSASFPWHQSGSPLNNFNNANGLNFPGSQTAQLQPGGSGNWLQTVLGKRK